MKDKRDSSRGGQGRKKAQDQRQDREHGREQGGRHGQGRGQQPGRRGRGSTASQVNGATRSASGVGAAVGERQQPPTWVAKLPVAEGEIHTVEIVGLGHEGEGVGRVGGYTLFVRGALPGELVRARVTQVKKQFGRAELLQVLEQSPERVAASCPIYEQCGGCQLQHLDYAAQLRWKRQLVVDSLERIAKLPVAAPGAAAARGESADSSGTGAVVVHPVIGMDEPWRYRNKGQVPFGQSEGGLVGGFYAQGTHDVVEMDACLIQHERNDDVVRQVKAIARELGISGYDETTGRGLLRHVVVKIGVRTGELMLVLVTNGRDIQHADALVGLLREAVPGLRSICQNINTAQTSLVFGDETRVLWGEEVIYDEIGDIRFAISARSFYQVNPTQTEKLYGQALAYAGLTGRETVIDAYCGIGTISLFLARHADRVYGVEIVEEAIADARRNAALNGIRNADFAVGRAEDVLPAWRRQGITADVIVVDPPRKGCDPALLETLLEMHPVRIVYVSCDPATLARDLRILADGGYRVAEVQPVDMFPHTVHVESVTLLVKND